MNQVPVYDSRIIAAKWKGQILERPINKGVLVDFSVCFRFWRSRVWIPAGSRGIGEANPYLKNHLIIENHLSKKSRAQSLYLGELRHLFREAMHHPKTLIGQELLHQTIVNYKKFYSNKNYQSITFWHNNLNFNGLCTVILCSKLTLSITILKITNICRWNRYHFLRFTDIGSAIKDAGFGIKRYRLKK